VKNKARRVGKKVWGLVVCSLLFAGPALAANDVSANSQGFQIALPISGETSLSDSFSLVSKAPTPESNPIPALDPGTENQAARYSNRPQFVTGMAPSPNGGSSLFAATMVSLVALEAADYITTLKALKYPQCQEANPLMQAIVKNQYVFAAVKLGISYLSVRYLGGLRKRNPALAWVATALANGMLTYVVVNNWNVIQKLKRLNP
jgi:hypothetical protein